jgi:DNA mismatch endonuclease Vsr
MGYRYRLHATNLPGRPDLVFPGRRKVIEVRGCFWHRHPGCAFAAMPGTRSDFWQAKFQATVARDARNLAALEASGWAVMVIWECELKDPHLADRMRTFLGPPRSLSATKVF